MMKQYSVDIIIPTYKPGREFFRLLEMLKRQSYPINRIIIMDTVSESFPAKWRSKVSDLEIHSVLKKEFDHGKTRDDAAKMSKSDIIMFMTQDAIPKDEALVQNLLAAFKDEKVGAAYARQLPAPGCKVIEAYTREFNYPKTSQIKAVEDMETLGIKTFFCSNVCAAYRRSVYEQNGGFVHEAIFNEDMIFAGRLIKRGYKIAYTADARVIHSHNYNNIEQLRRNFDLAVSQKMYPEVFAGVKSEGEGIRLVKKTASYLFRIKKPYLIIELMMKSGFKFLGYKLGGCYQYLPKWFIYRITMNPSFWENV